MGLKSEWKSKYFLSQLGGKFEISARYPLLMKIELCHSDPFPFLLTTPSHVSSVLLACMWFPGRSLVLDNQLVASFLGKLVWFLAFFSYIGSLSRGEAYYCRTKTRGHKHRPSLGVIGTDQATVSQAWTKLQNQVELQKLEVRQWRLQGHD